MSGIVILIIGALVYFLPSILGHEKRNAAAILALNIFLGWTVVGWVVALVWAVSVEAPLPAAAPAAPSYLCGACRAPVRAGQVKCVACGKPLNWPAPAGLKKCPDCAEQIQSDARKCRFCGLEFMPEKRTKV